MNSTIPRLQSVDIVRGGIMILMVLDHARYYFTRAIPEPEVLAQEDVLLFFTRWITHLCAPGFFLLAGVSAWLSLASPVRSASPGTHLLTRGLMLIVLELTVVGYAWFLSPGASFGGVLWALGWSFIALAAALRLGHRGAGIAGLLIMTFHHLLDAFTPQDFGTGAWLWHILHARGLAQIPFLGDWYILYPLLPWVGVMMLGYGLGPLFAQPSRQRRFVLVAAGIAFTAAFLLLRTTGIYGQPLQSSIVGVPTGFVVQDQWLATVIALLNTEKYPPSLQYLLMTLGPVLVVLGLLAAADDRTRLPRSVHWLALAGSVPLFFYVAHLYLLRAMAIVVATLAEQPVDWLWFDGSNVRPTDYGYGFGGVYVAFLFACGILVPACYGWNRWRIGRRQPRKLTTQPG